MLIPMVKKLLLLNHYNTRSVKNSIVLFRVTNLYDFDILACTKPLMTHIVVTMMSWY